MVAPSLWEDSQVTLVLKIREQLLRICGSIRDAAAIMKVFVAMELDHSLPL